MQEQHSSTISKSDFLKGRSGLADLIKSHDWSKTSIGVIDSWPQSLKTAINISLNSKIATVIFWGREMVRIYNDAYSNIIGNKHPWLLGSKGSEQLLEAWGIIGNKFEECFNDGVAGQEENVKVSLERSGIIEECHFSLDYSPLYNEENRIGGVYLTITETTELIRSDKRLRSLRDQQLAKLFMNAPIALCIFRGPQLVIETANDQMLELWGKTKEQVNNRPVMEALPEIKGQGFDDTLLNILKTGERVVAEEMPVELIRGGKKETVYVKFVYEALKEDDGTVSAIMALADEITPVINTRKAIQESEERLRMAIESTKLGTWDYNPVTGELNWSDECRSIYQFPKDKKIDFEIFTEHIFSEDKEYALREIQRSMDPSGSGQYDITYRIIRYTDRSPRWIKATGKVYFNHHHQADRFIGTVVDITESRSLQEALRVNEQRLRLAVEAAEMGTFDWDIKTSEFIYSKRLAQIFGYSDTEGLFQSSFGDRIHPDDKKIRIKAHEECFRTGVLFYEVRVVWPNNTNHWVRLNGKVIFDAAGNPDKMYGTALDVTEQRVILQELQESEKQFKTLADTAPAMIWTSGLNMECDFFNKGWLDFTGRTIEQEMGNGWTENVHADDVERCINIYVTSFEARKKFSMEYRLKRYDGKYCWIIDEGTPRYNVEGEFIGYIGACLDIQEKKMAREELERKVLERTSELNKKNHELREQKEFVDKILDASVDVIAVFDSEMRYVTLNRKGYELYNVNDDVLGKKIYEIFPRIKDSGMYTDLQKAISGEIVHSPKYKSVVVDKYFENFYIPLKDDRDKVYGVLLLSHDTTELVKSTEKLLRTNEELEEKNIALERSNKELESFSYVASHDLQEPLRKIRTFAELVQKNFNNEELTKKYFQKIDSSAQRMSDLIKAVLNYSRLSRTDEHFENVDLDKVIENVKSDFELIIAEKDVTIIHGQLPVIQAISLQMNQLFSNLINNSIKFSNKKPIIKIHSEFIGADNIPADIEISHCEKYLRISFMDNGIGFEQQYSDQIFTIFKRLHGAQAYAGTGIGLALCKKIVENHKGSITAKSEPGKGTEFVIYLPV